MDLIEELKGHFDRDEAPEAITSTIVEHLLDVRIQQIVRVRDYVDSHDLALFVVSLFKDFERDPELRQRLSDLLRDVGRDARESDLTLRDLTPAPLERVLEHLVTREYHNDPDFVRRLIHHPVMRKVIRNVLEDTLSEFVERLTEWFRDSNAVPGMSGAWSLFSGMFGMARRYTKRFASEFESRVQERIDFFVDEMIGEVLDKMVMELSSSTVASDLARWREEGLQTLLDRPLDRYLEEYSRSEADSESDPVDVLVREVGTLEEDDLLGPLETFIDLNLDALERRRFGDILERLNVKSPVKERLVEIVT